MYVIDHCWVVAPYHRGSFALEIKDSASDPVFLFVPQFVLQDIWHPQGAFGQSRDGGGLRLLNCLKNEDLSAHL